MGLERLLAPWPERRVLCDDERLLVIDKLAGIPVHGGDERNADDLIARLRARDLQRGAARYIGVHQRLDQQVSGLMFLNRNPEDNRLLAKASEQRSIRRSYLALVQSTAQTPRELANSGTLQHQLLPVKGQRTLVVKGGGQRAVMHFEVRERCGPRSLVSLVLETGRKHQIRAQLAHIGFPIVGDRLYEGVAAPRLMLHCVGLDIEALGRSFASEAPAYLRSWLTRATLRLELDWHAALEDAGCLRWALLGKTQVFRLINDEADLMPGVCVDVYDQHATLSVSTNTAFRERERLAQALIRAGLRGVYLKTRVRADLRRRDPAELAPPDPIAGEPLPSEATCVNEAGIRFRVSLAEGLSTGLFVDQRDNRARVRAASRGLRVLNLFAYTCSFSVAAALGGAKTVVSVDLSKRALERGKANFALNALDISEHRFYADDALKFLARAGRRGETFDLIIVDPPSFGSRGKATFSVQASYQALLLAAIQILVPHGEVLAVTNHRKTSPAKLRKMLKQAVLAQGRQVVSINSLKSGLDCPDDSLGPAPAKSAWLVVG